jgi:5-methylcytosine-specific restriction endonuclease McrA
MSWFAFQCEHKTLVEFLRQVTDVEARTVYIDEETDWDINEYSWLIPRMIEVSVPKPKLKKFKVEKIVTKKQIIKPGVRIPLNEGQRYRILMGVDNRCQRCGYERGLQIHHKDENPANNTLKNLEVLCYACHKEMHSKVARGKRI